MVESDLIIKYRIFRLLMKKSFILSIVCLFFVPLILDARTIDDTEYNYMDSLMNDYETKQSLKKALFLLKSCGDKEATLDSLNRLNSDEVNCQVYYYFSGYMLDNFRCTTSLQYAKKCLKYAESLPDNEGYLGGCYNIMGICYQRWGLYDSAIEFLKKSVEYSIKLNEFTDAAVDYNNIAHFCYENHDVESAGKYLEAALEMLKKAEKQNIAKKDLYYVQANVYGFACSYYLETGQYAKALHYNTESYYLDSINHRTLDAKVRKFTKARILQHIGRENYAQEMLEELLQYFIKENETHYAAECLFYLGRYEEALPYAHKIDEVNLQTKILEKLIFEEPDFSKSKEYMKEYMLLKDSLTSNANILAREGFNAEYESQQKEQTIKLQNVALEKQYIKWYWAISISALLLIVIVFSVRGWIKDNKHKKSISSALSDLKVASEKLAESNAALEKTNVVKDKLIRVISHDLSGSTSNVNMLAHMVADDVNNNLTSMLVSQCDSLKSFFDDLLIWVRMQKTGSIEIHPTQLSLNEIVDDVMKLFVDSANHKGIKLNHTIPEGASVFADRSLIHCVVRNLVNNAIKFTSHGGSVTIGYQQDVISVEDTGVGMAPNVVEALLSGSEWVHTNGTDGEVGTGLGLSIVRDMLSMMGASLSIESEVGKGSVFSIHL